MRLEAREPAAILRQISEILKELRMSGEKGRAAGKSNRYERRGA